MTKRKLQDRIAELETENAVLSHFIDRLTAIGKQIDDEYKAIKDAVETKSNLIYASTLLYCTCEGRFVFIGIEKRLVKHECIKCGSIHWYNATSDDIGIPLNETTVTAVED